MKKYLLIIHNSLMEYFTYRLNFFLWRVRVVLSILITFFLWQAVFKSTHEILSYKESQMFTYIILLNFIASIAQSTQTFKIAHEINSGRLSNFLLQPINYFYFNLSRDLADKIINVIFSFFEIWLMFLTLKVPFNFQSDLYWIFLFILASFFASILYFEINVFLSFIGFWSKEIWAPRFVFSILVSFLSGTYFPLDIIPFKIFNLLKFLPFPYLIFFPLKVYLGNLPSRDILQGFVISLLWILMMIIILKFLWRRGLKIYTAQGY